MCWIKGSQDESCAVRHACLWALTKNPALAKKYWRELLPRLSDESYGVRLIFIGLLRNWFPEKQASLAWMGRAAEEPLTLNQARAVWTSLAADDDSALVEALHHLLASTNAHLQLFAVEAGLKASNLPPELRTWLAALSDASFNQGMENWRLRGDPTAGPLFPESES